MMDSQAMIRESAPFLNYLVEWQANLPTPPLAEAITDPAHTAIICVDLTQGFCSSGALASPRVGAIVPAIVRLFERAHELGVQHWVLPQDTHEPDAVEFGSFAPHCVRGTSEAETTPELARLPFAHQFVVIPKNSINSTLAPGFQAWRESHPDVHTFIVVGDCTDYCVYQLAVGLRAQANDRQMRQVQVLVPADCVDTYDLPVEVAQQLQILPHPGNLIHAMSLYHMALNGVRVVGKLD